MNTIKVAFIGAGQIGTGLALNCIIHGIPVTLQTLQTEQEINLCKHRIESGLRFFLENHLISEEDAEQARKRVTITSTIADAVKDASLISESVPDSVELKQSVIAQIEAACPETAVITSSTSSCSISEIFENAVHPERCMGGHPYNPSYLIPLVEITKGKNTDAAYVEKAKEIFTQMGKVPVVLNKEVIGFIGNRYQSAIHREAVDLIENGVCSVEDADKALVYSVGIRWGVMGQFLTMHLAATPEGIGNFDRKFHNQSGVPDKRLSHMPVWTAFPDDWCELAQKGLDEALKKRPAETGQDIPSIENWRDKLLIAILKLHGIL